MSSTSVTWLKINERSEQIFINKQTNIFETCVCVCAFNQSFNFPWFFFLSKVVQIVIHLYKELRCKGMPVSIFCHFQFRSTLLSLDVDWMNTWVCLCKSKGNKQISIFHFDTMQYFSFIWNIINRLRSSFCIRQYITCLSVWNVWMCKWKQK